jgi:hypothetical protein
VIHPEPRRRSGSLRHRIEERARDQLYFSHRFRLPDRAREKNDTQQQSPNG